MEDALELYTEAAEVCLTLVSLYTEITHISESVHRGLPYSGEFVLRNHSH